MKKVLIDRYIPFDGNPFDNLAEVRLLEPEQFSPEIVKDADALIVRTRTRCDHRLLAGSRVSIVATATIGTDHLALPWLAENHIKTVSAPGCNAPAVAQYVLASIFALNLGYPGMRLGVIGLGHVGSIIASWARNLGIEVLACDPPRQQRDGGWNPLNPSEKGDEQFLSIDQVARKADILTFHTPLTRDGNAPTYHLLNRDLLSIAPKAMVINAARGSVADTADLISALRSGRVDKAAIDCWEGEPLISQELLRLAQITTPHIAGYSIEGKRRATAITFNAVLEHFGSERRIDPAVAMTPPASVTFDNLMNSYDPLTDSLPLKSTPSAFEHLRNHYLLRHEVPS